MKFHLGIYIWYRADTTLTCVKWFICYIKYHFLKIPIFQYTSFVYQLLIQYWVEVKVYRYYIGDCDSFFNFTFNVSEADSDIIEAFLDARAADNVAFNFTPPGEASSSKFVCEEWNKTIEFIDRATIQATFRQVFEP